LGFGAYNDFYWYKPQRFGRVKIKIARHKSNNLPSFTAQMKKNGIQNAVSRF